MRALSRTLDEDKGLEPLPDPVGVDPVEFGDEVRCLGHAAIGLLDELDRRCQIAAVGSRAGKRIQREHLDVGSSLGSGLSQKCAEPVAGTRHLIRRVHGGQETLAQGSLLSAA